MILLVIFFNISTFVIEALDLISNNWNDSSADALMLPRAIVTEFIYITFNCDGK